MTQVVTNTISYLRKCQAYRAAGGQVCFTTDPKWLVNMAINRRAGWPDDPSSLRGSAMAINGKYPKSASGDDWSHLRLFAHRVNTPRLIVREHECPKWLRGRLEHRFFVE
jgi:hypothetical protein